MAQVFKWLMRLAGGMVVLSVMALALIYYFAARSLPDYDRRVSVAKLSAETEIVRDNANVPHVFAPEDAAVYFGLGFAHAQDRLWQMTVMRRTAKGQLSEVFGEATLPTDTFMRRLDLNRLARTSLEAQSPYARSMLQAYSDGVNARFTQINEEALGRGAPEMFLFNAPIAPWVPSDSILLLKLFAVQGSAHLPDEIMRARVSLALPDESRVKDLLPDHPGPGTAVLPEYSNLFPALEGTVTQHAALSREQPLLSPLAPRGFSAASNAWAAAPARSASGGTLLANDPHFKLTAPGLWYLARLELETGGVIGATIPGVPLVLSGRSSRLGWGITSAYADDQDLYIEQLNPATAEEYLSVDGFKPFEKRGSIINIKDANPVTLQLRWTDNGPVLPPSHLSVGTITPPGHVVSLAWSALSPNDSSITAGLRLMRAQDVADAIAAGEEFVAPALNLTMVDLDTIAMKTIGRLPRRDAGHVSQGRIPSQGWLPQNRWNGAMPYLSNPEFVAPVSGILGNTNNKTIERPFPNHVSFTWGDTQRVRRWEGLMQNREVHTRDSFIEAQQDTVSYTARALLPLIGADLWFTGEAAPDGTPERRRHRALALLASWNGEMNEHLPEPLLYAAWIRALQTRLIQDDLGPLATEFTHVEPLFIERVFRDVDGASVWCDVKQSSRVETCAEMAQLALDDALIWIEESWGDNFESLRWGDAHQAIQDHPTLGDVPLLSTIVNIRQSTSGGDNTLQRGLTKGTEPNPFHNVHAAGYRGVYDFADPDSSVFVLSTGQSGHVLSRHYDDMAQLWRRGEYIPMSLDPELARAASVGVTTLVPQQ